MHNLYARFVLWLIRPALRLAVKQQASIMPHGSKLDTLIDQRIKVSLSQGGAAWKLDGRGRFSITPNAAAPSEDSSCRS